MTELRPDAEVGALGPRVEGPSPVTVISREQIDAQGYRNAFDALSALTENTGNVQGEDFGNTFTPAANTINLRGRAGLGQGFLHWSNNFDEVQDFEGQIRALAGGTGLMSDAAFNAGTHRTHEATASASNSATSGRLTIRNRVTFRQCRNDNPNMSSSRAHRTGSTRRYHPAIKHASPARYIP